MTTRCCSHTGPRAGIATLGSAASESMIAGRGIWIVASRAKKRERECVCVCVWVYYIDRFFVGFNKTETALKV